MENKHIAVKVTLNLDEQWVNNHTPEELTDFLKVRLNHALGFRGYVKKVKTVQPK
ncbi:MAG: hypothetical protein JSV02_10555 [Dehalococcoidia bacterium]|nr:MAG: hypothetical protein JSV02_10555 [Dehalococcoidia bacterium]